MSETVDFNINGDSVTVLIEGGALAPGMSIANEALNAAVAEAQQAAEDATVNGALAGAAAGTTAGASAGASAGTTAGTTAANAVVATKANKIGDTFTGPTYIQGSFQLRALDDGTQPPPLGVYFGSGGNSLSFQTLISSPSGAADFDNQRGQFLIVTETTDDGNSEEQSVCLLTTIKTGYSKDWATNTAFSVGDNISFPSPRNTVYRCIQAGTSAASGTGPTGQGQNIVDGTVRWRWINDAAINAKLAIYNEVVLEPGAGSSWAHVNNLEVESGVLTKFVCNTELDLTNNSGTNSTTANGFNKLGLWIAAQGANKSTAGLQISSANTSSDALIWGAYFAGSRLASNSLLQFDANSAVGIGFGVAGGGVINPTFTDSVIKDSSTAPKAIALSGTYASSAIEVTGATPASFVSGGTKTTAGFYDLSTAPAGLSLKGTYSAAQIDGKNGFAVFDDGAIWGKSVRIAPAAPASSTAPGTPGTILVDANYIYVCTASNTWKRVALTAY